MDVRNRMADVIKLRCNACQDFLKMIIADGWQQEVYSRAKSEIERHTYQKDKFIAAYEKMREIGIDNYSIDDMDVSFISALVHYCGKIAPTDVRTRKSIEKLIEDRNITDHSSENEEDEELYLRGLLALCNLKDFIRVIDKVELSIPDEQRIEYRKIYSKKIDELKDILDDERIVIIQRKKDIERDINRILECADEDEQLRVWCELNKLYMDRYMKLEKDFDKYIEFIIAASDAGIKEAHNGAIDAFLLIDRDYEQVEKRLYKLYDSYDILPAYEAKSIIDVLNVCIIREHELTAKMKELVPLIRNQGYSVEETTDGLYKWSNKE